MQTLQDLLARHWDKLAGGTEQRIAPSKLHRGIEDVEWRQPILQFKLERHGPTSRGSTKATVHEWRGNVDAGRAEWSNVRSRIVGKRWLNMVVAPLAAAAVDLVSRGQDDEQLKWAAEKKRANRRG